MKRMLLLFILFVTFYNLLFSQAKEKELSNAEKFSSKSGTLMQKEFVDIGLCS